MKEFIKSLPVIGNLALWAYKIIFGDPSKKPFPGSAEYWERRYEVGGDSGVGSYTFFAEFKAEVINGFVADNNIQSVIDFGCGDGNQLTLAKYPKYLGLDVSVTAINHCREMFKSDDSKTFRLYSELGNETADLTISLDVIYHLVEDVVFEKYMKSLFDTADKFVIIYSSDTDDNSKYESTHVRLRKFTNWVKVHANQWKLIKHIPNKYPDKGDYRTGSMTDFFIYQKIQKWPVFSENIASLNIFK